MIKKYEFRIIISYPYKMKISNRSKKSERPFRVKKLTKDLEK